MSTSNATGRGSVGRLLLAGLLTGIAIYLTTFVHEMTHFIVGKILGFEPFFTSIDQVAWRATASNVHLGVYSAAAAPAVSIALGIIGLVVCARFRSSDSVLLTAIRAATAVTLLHLGISLFLTPVQGGDVDISKVIDYFGTPVPVRMALVVLGLVLIVVPAIAFGRWALRVDGREPVRIGRWRPVVAAVLAAAQLVVLVLHLVSFTSPEPTSMPIIDLVAVLLTLPVIGALLTPWRQRGVRALVRRDAAPVWIGFGLQVILSVLFSPVYALSVATVIGTVMIGIATAARTGHPTQKEVAY